MSEYLSVINFVHLALMLGACAGCYFWGKLNGAVNLAVELINHKLVTLEQLKKLDPDFDEE